MRFGIRQFITTPVVLGVLMAFDANPFWRLPLLFMFWALLLVTFKRAILRAKLVILRKGFRTASN